MSYQNETLIENFKLKDLEQILEIERESFPKKPWDRRTFLFYYKTFPQGFLVARKNEKVVGYAIFSPPDTISSIAAAREMRGKGIGKKLVEEIIRRSKPKKT